MDQIAKLVLSMAEAKRVILFGSHVSGAVSEESDIDVMIIVVDDSVRDLRTLRRQLHVAISEVVSRPCDVLVEHESTFEHRSALPTLERVIEQTGKRSMQFDEFELTRNVRERLQKA